MMIVAGATNAIPFLRSVNSIPQFYPRNTKHQSKCIFISQTKYTAQSFQMC